MSIRDRHGNSVGTLVSSDLNTRVVSDTSGVQYIQHTRYTSDNNLAQDGAIEWVVSWKKPAQLIDSAFVHVAANASNGDNSALGDYVYTSELGLPPGR